MAFDWSVVVVITAVVAMPTTVDTAEFESPAVLMMLVDWSPSPGPWRLVPLMSSGIRDSGTRPAPAAHSQAGGATALARAHARSAVALCRATRLIDSPCKRRDAPLLDDWSVYG